MINYDPFSFPDDPSPTGYLRVEKFIPETYVAANAQPAPDPFQINGPFSGIYEPAPGHRYQIVPGFGEAEGFVRGFLPRGKPLLLDGLIHSLHEHKFPEISVQFLPHLGDPFAESSYGGEPNDRILNVSNQPVYVYDLLFAGNASLGFDNRSNPPWQLLPVEQERHVNFLLSPSGAVSNADLIPDAALTAERVENVTNAVALRNRPGTPFGEGQVQVQGIRGTLKADIRPPRNPTVAVYPVYRRKRDALHPDGVRIPTTPIALPTKAALEAELNRVYGNNANVWFNVTIAPEVLEFDDGEDLDGDGRCALNSAEQSQFENKAATDSYTYSIFLFDFGGWSRYFPLGGFTVQGIGGLAFQIPGDFVFTDSPGVNLLAHELGHCMGLEHTFQAEIPYGAANIPDHSETRVMGYGEGGGRVIKPERDIIHARLQALGL